MVKVTFKGKTKHLKYVDGESAGVRISVPHLTRNHCDMSAFRQHAQYRDFANSDLFESVLNRRAEKLFGGDYVRLDDVPDGVAVDLSGFLAVVTFDL